METSTPRAGLRILVVDDHPINRRVARGLLGRDGHEVREAVDGQEALERLAAESFDVVLMDVEMPVLDGLQATRLLRAREAPGARTTVIAVTGSTRPEEVERALQAGMDDTLSKPLRLAALKAVLERWTVHPPTPPAVAVTAPDGVEPLFDEEILADILELAQDGREIIDALLDRFLEVSSQHLLTLEQAVRDGTPEPLRKAAHALAGGCATLGSRRLMGLAGRIESAGKQGETASVAVLVARLPAEIEALHRGLLERVRERTGR